MDPQTLVLIVSVLVVVALAIIYFQIKKLLDSKSSEAYFKRGKILLDTKKDDSAIKDFSEMIKLNPKDGRAYHSRGLAKLKLKKKKDACKDLKKAGELGYFDAYADIKKYCK